jgi:hypothetical protein
VHVALAAELDLLPGAGNRRFRCLSALRAHTKAPYKMDFHRKTRRALNRPEAARTVAALILKRIGSGASSLRDVV